MLKVSPSNLKASFFKKFLITVWVLSAAGGINRAFSQDNGGAVSTTLTAESSDGIFTSTASYSFQVQNTYKTIEEGKLSYLVTTEAGKKVKADSIHIKINKQSSSVYNFSIPGMRPGFYKINFMLNVSDYDDTTRRAFGIKPDEIHSKYPRPADFDAFWQTAKSDLAKVSPDYKLTEVPKMEKNHHKVYVVEMKSLDNMTIRAWFTEPGDQPKHKKFPVLLGLPGYQVDMHPIVGMDKDLAVITLDVRGQGASKDQLNIRKEDFIINNIENKNKYVMRGVIMDCIRCIDFIYSREDLRHDDIMVSGGSMGGYLAIATAGLDHRVTMCSAQNPIMSDINNLVGEVEWPLSAMQKYVNIKPGLTFQAVLNNLQYFDTKNFATTIKCPTLLGIGLLDPYVPPNNAFAVYNNIADNKKIKVYKDLGHEVTLDYKMYEVRWMNDTFGLF